jgi:hypothetical protein
MCVSFHQEQKEGKFPFIGDKFSFFQKHTEPFTHLPLLPCRLAIVAIVKLIAPPPSLARSFSMSRLILGNFHL